MPDLTTMPPVGSVARPAIKHVFIGRQPIYDRNLDLVAYELLFRSDEGEHANVIDGDSATFTVMLNALVEVGLHRLVGDKLAFINLTRNSVLCEYATLFPKEQMVMEVLEDVVVDEELLDLVRRFHAEGFKIALDDFVERAELVPLTELAHIIKVDVQALDRATIASYATSHADVELLAEKVETQAEYEYCKKLGFKYFQGYFLERPQVLKVVQVPTCQQTVLRCLMDLYSDCVSQERIAATISCDPFLTYRLLRAVGGRSGLNAITSTEDAVRLMGLDALKRWITLLSISGLDEACHATIVEGMVLSYACRELGRLWFGRHAPSLQLCGGLSVIPKSLGMEMTRLMRTLDLREDLQDALSGYGPWARLVEDVVHVHNGRAIPDRSPAEQQEIRAALLRGQEEARTTRIELGL